ncbi:CRE-RABN-5 protein [Aphelenchoides bicaudatus]|nr:CRE-RABN-5 protein [Aphelenchoides bicaudatus]
MTDPSSLDNIMDTPTRGQEPQTSNNVKRSDSEHEIKEKLEAMKQLADRYEKQLQDERAYRQELEKSFEKRSKELEEAITKLGEGSFAQKLIEMEKNFESQLKKTTAKFTELSLTNNQQRNSFNELSNRYQRLTGYYEKSANQMPTELSQAQALYQANAQQSQSERRSPDNIELRQTIDDLEKRLVETQAESNAMAQSLHEFRQRCSQLQHELDNSEAVQRDFVQLSQKLQVQLEVIRQGDHELRWEFAEDVKKCNNECNSDLKQQKTNCKHCGKIFCTSCLKQTVSGGPNSRQAHVCGVCYTLLSKNSAPFYSD